MKQNCTYFRYFHNFYFLEIKEVLVLFDKISRCHCEDSSDSTQSLVTIPVFFFCWAVLSMSSIQHQHPLRTLMQISCTYAHVEGSKPTSIFCPSRYTSGFLCVFGCGTAFVVVHKPILWLAVHCIWAGTGWPKGYVFSINYNQNSQSKNTFNQYSSEERDERNNNSHPIKTLELLDQEIPATSVRFRTFSDISGQKIQRGAKALKIVRKQLG